MKELGLITSEEKCVWTPTQIQKWTGLVFDLKNLVVAVPKDKVERAVDKLKELKNSENKFVPVKKAAAVTGLLISFRLALTARVTRFRTRWMLIDIMHASEEQGWNGRLRF